MGVEHFYGAFLLRSIAQMPVPAFGFSAGDLVSAIGEFLSRNTHAVAAYHFLLRSCEED